MFSEVTIHFNMGKPDFADWLRTEIEARGWTASDFARRAEVPHAMVGFVLGGQKFPDPDFCVGTARAFNIPPERVFRRAGLLPSEPSAAPDVEEVLHLMEQLTDEQQQAVMALMRTIVAHRLKAK